MHICILTQYYPPEVGAPQARISELCQYFYYQGHTATVLTGLPNYPTGKIFNGYYGLFRKEITNGVNVFRTYVYPSKSIKLLPRLWNYFSFVFSSFFFGLFTLPKCDVLITESPPLFLGISGFLLSKAKKAKWIFNVSDLWPESALNLGVIGSGFPLKLSRGLESFCYREAWLVTGQSREIVANISERFPEVKLYKLSNGVDVTKFNKEQKSDILKQWANGKNYTAVYAGLHGIAQGLDQIIKAAIRLEEEVRELQIILVGDGPEKTELIKLTENMKISNITFVDPQQKEKMPQIWASADIAIIPLKQYIPGAVPSKLYEAMASDVPICLIADGEPAEIVNESNCGMVVCPADIDGIVRTLETLVKNGEKRKIMGRYGRVFVKNNFNRQIIFDNFSEFLEAEGNF